MPDRVHGASAPLITVAGSTRPSVPITTFRRTTVNVVRKRFRTSLKRGVAEKNNSRNRSKAWTPNTSRFRLALLCRLVLLNALGSASHLAGYCRHYGEVAGCCLTSHLRTKTRLPDFIRVCTFRSGVPCTMKSGNPTYHAKSYNTF
jgi:hypothetical protein